MKTYKFYDTSSLLLKVDALFENPEEKVVISSITLKELEHIKTATNKDPDIKYAARRLLHILDEKIGQYNVCIFHMNMLGPITDKDLPIIDDTKILSTAIDFYCSIKPEDEFIFITNDLSLKHLAMLFFENVESVNENVEDEYTGYLDMRFSEEDMAKLYEHYNENIYNLLINQYLIVRDIDGNIVDTMCWTGEEYRHLNYRSFNSRHFGEVKPYKGDIYQTLLADSLINNKITLIKGPAGTGKTYLSLSFLLSQLERGKIDKIIVFCNTVATKNSAKLGYYPGTRDEKLLDSQIGNLLISKFGGRMIVD